mmetsp:Transcript_5853/g.19914  ORF Transcript_5853/g.19914 Transcript_5853/m.19914 type:complete len:342 (-) Transcript_5853:114-1139(-)
MTPRPAAITGACVRASKHRSGLLRGACGSAGAHCDRAGDNKPHRRGDDGARGPCGAHRHSRCRPDAGGRGRGEGLLGECRGGEGGDLLLVLDLDEVRQPAVRRVTHLALLGVHGGHAHRVRLVRLHVGKALELLRRVRVRRVEGLEVDAVHDLVVRVEAHVLDGDRVLVRVHLRARRLRVSGVGGVRGGAAGRAHRLDKAVDNGPGAELLLLGPAEVLVLGRGHGGARLRGEAVLPLVRHVVDEAFEAHGGRQAQVLGAPAVAAVALRVVVGGPAHLGRLEGALEAVALGRVVLAAEATTAAGPAVGVGARLVGRRRPHGRIVRTDAARRLERALRVLALL